VRQVAQASLPAAALNCPAAHVAHVRSLPAVGALSRNLPAAHGALTVAQTLPSFAVENVAPTTQAAHARSAISEPACDSPAPMAHFFHGLHAWLPETDLNVPDAQVLHWRSDEAPNAAVSYWPGVHTVMARHTRSASPVGAANVYWPAGHTARWVTQSRSDCADGCVFSNSPPVQTVTGAHAAPLLVPDHVEPTAQGAHVRSDVAVGALDWPKPAGHVLNRAHFTLPALLLNSPAGHTSHVRSADAVAIAKIARPFWHGALTPAHASPLFSGE